ncbi:MAG: hypothetical protein ACHQCF_04140 [Solirubrobacterales bacterium]
MLTTALVVLAVTLITAAVACAEEAPPTREQYVATVDPICKSNTDENKRILKGASQRVNAGKLSQAGKQFTRAAAAFGKSVKEISAVPRPPADNARLEKWFGFLKIIQTNLAKVGTALNEGNKVRAVHEKIRAERSSNAANNVSFVFGFKYCHLAASQFK